MDELTLTDLNLEKSEEISSAETPILEEMMQVGLFWGHKKSKTHPRMRQNIFTTRAGMEIIDLSKTLKALNKSLEFVKSTVASGGKVLFVGTTASARAGIEEVAKKLGASYVIERWLGGTLTNFKTLSKRISYFKKLKADRAANKFDKYTKKERLEIDREIDKLTLKFSGIEDMDGMPKIVVVIDVPEHLNAVREAKIVGSKVIALVNTDVNPDTIDYAIPANDRSRAGIEWFLNKVSDAVLEAKAQVKKVAEVK